MAPSNIKGGILFSTGPSREVGEGGICSLIWCGNCEQKVQDNLSLISSSCYNTFSIKTQSVTPFLLLSAFATKFCKNLSACSITRERLNGFSRNLILRFTKIYPHILSFVKIGQLKMKSHVHFCA